MVTATPSARPRLRRRRRSMLGLENCSRRW
uniref:Uncharacterized protein n=1 Tax=Arundo donax TaxID=35708 RepID=A0A0A9C5I9_ARUDO